MPPQVALGRAVWYWTAPTPPPSLAARMPPGPPRQVIPREYTLALMEYIAHLTTGDWDSLIDDLVALGFVDSVDDRESLVGGGPARGGGGGGTGGGGTWGQRSAMTAAAGRWRAHVCPVPAGGVPRPVASPCACAALMAEPPPAAGGPAGRHPHPAQRGRRRAQGQRGGGDGGDRSHDGALRVQGGRPAGWRWAGAWSRGRRSPRLGRTKRGVRL